MTEEEQLPLFDGPAPPPPYRPPRRTPLVAGVRYAKRPKGNRALCDDCCADIHRLGQARAPYPHTALWRRVVDNGPPLLLCQAHKDGRVANETG